MMMTGRRTLWPASALLLGAYTFGYNFHNIVHEFGHAVTIWLQGGSVLGFVVHPFLACYSPSTYVPNHILLYAGGALIGGSSTILFALLAWRWRSPLAMPLVMTCVAGLLTTSRWMLLAPFQASQTDYWFLISLGVPAVVIVLWGLLFLVVGISVLALYLPLLGIPHRTSFLDHLTVLELGVLPYQLAASLFYLVSGETSISGLVSAVFSEAFIIAVLALFITWAPRRIRALGRIEAVTVRSGHIAIVWLVTAALIASMLIFSASREHVVL